MLRFFLYLIDLVVLFFVLRRLLDVFVHLVRGRRVQFRTSTAGFDRGEGPRTIRGETARDPICGTFVSTELSHRLKQGDHTLHFCSPECLERYQKNHA